MWEYKVSTYRPNPESDKLASVALEEWMNALGRDGWELVLNQAGFNYVFKRRLVQKTEG